MKNNEARLLWALVEGYKKNCTVPMVWTKPVFAPVAEPDIWELDALDDFIKLKEQQIAHHQHVAITETQ